MTAKKHFRNNVTRALDSRGIEYQTYPLPEEKISALKAAETIGIPPTHMYKTIVALIPPANKRLLIMIPANCEVDLKSVARAIRVKKVIVATHAQAESLTGLQVGGISPLALINRGFSTFIDKSAKDLDKLYLSAGQLGMILQLAVTALVEMTGAIFVDACRKPETY